MLDTSGVHRRALELVSLLEKLSLRPDIRYSEPFTKFIEVHGGASNAHELSRGRFQLENRFGVIGLAGYSDALIGVHADTTSLSRLGKVWSIVESDELGSLSIWTIKRGRSTLAGEESALLPLGEKVYYRILGDKPNSFCLSESAHIVLGSSNGHIEVYDIRDPAVSVMNVPAHGISPVVSVRMAGAHTIVSIGLDDAIRITDMQSRQVVAGGKLSKRLESGEHLACLETLEQRIFVGTDKGHVFIYQLGTSSPSLEYVHKITLTSYPVRSFTFDPDHELLAVGYDSMVSVFDIASGARQYEKIGSIFTTKATSVHAIKFIPKSSYILTGLSDGTVALYHWTRAEGLSFSSTLMYARYFSEDPINVIHYSHPDGVIWVGADDGRVVEVILPMNIAGDIANIAEPVVDTSGGVVQDVSPTRLKCCLDENDSESEDWKKNIFSDVRT